MKTLNDDTEQKLSVENLDSLMLKVLNQGDILGKLDEIPVGYEIRQILGVDVQLSVFSQIYQRSRFNILVRLGIYDKF